MPNFKGGKGFKKKKKVNQSEIISPKIDFPDHFWEVHTKIQETITELRVKVNCARSHLVQFHNGGHFIDGISMKRMSLTHESLERSVSGEMKNHQDLLMSIYMEILKVGLEKSHGTGAGTEDE